MTQYIVYDTYKEIAPMVHLDHMNRPAVFANMEDAIPTMLAASKQQDAFVALNPDKYSRSGLQLMACDEKGAPSNYNYVQNPNIRPLNGAEGQNFRLLISNQAQNTAQPPRKSMAVAQSQVGSSTVLAKPPSTNAKSDAPAVKRVLQGHNM